MGGSEIGGKVHHRKINICIGKGRPGKSKERLKLFESGLSGVLVLIINTNRKNDYFNLRVGGGLFTNFQEMVGICSRVTVQLYLFIAVGWDAFDIRIS